MVVLALKLLLAFALPLISALKFDIQAHPGHESAKQERCIRNFVAKDQLVVVTATISGSRGDGQTLNMHVSGDVTCRATRARQMEKTMSKVILTSTGPDQRRSRQRLPPPPRHRRRSPLRLHFARRLRLRRLLREHPQRTRSRREPTPQRRAGYRHWRRRQRLVCHSSRREAEAHGGGAEALERRGEGGHG